MMVHCRVINTVTTPSSTNNGSQLDTSMTTISAKKSKNTHARPRITEPMASKTHVNGVNVIWRRTALAKIKEKPTSATTKPQVISQWVFPIDKACKTRKL